MGISDEELKKKVISTYLEIAFGRANKKKLRYKTSDVLSLFFDIGWEVQTVTERNYRYEDMSSYQKYLLILEHKDMVYQEEGKVNVVIRDSNDHPNSLEIFYGFFRYAGHNQLLFRNQDSEYQQRISPNDKPDSKFVKDRVAEIHFGFNEFLDDIRFLKSKILSMDQVIEFANQALRYRFRTKRVEFERDMLRNLLTIYRNEDNEYSAWNVLNRVQEAISKKFAVYPSKRNSLRYRKVEPIYEIDRRITLNCELWNFAKNI
ncbi:DUF932 domain-containing protein [Leptospira mayottensis]|uniref:DUF932 domain-containing protein n=1 Tax=Leptospira mayottensis TaxID=1137606 RepID=UPI000E35DF85|nr:DUF932 domain-containing protein [Leptospira mayottensis]AXR68722.1 hypothetical protein DPV73_12625 [Leptospira mayottensis]